MQSGSELSRSWLEHHGFAVPENDIDDIFAAASDLSRTVAAEARQLAMSDIDTDFSETLKGYAPATPKRTHSGKAGPVEKNPHSDFFEKNIQQSLHTIAHSPLGDLAWVRLDSEDALNKARKQDAAIQSGQAPGVLHGVTLGLKDMIDRVGFTAQWGSLLRGEAPVAQRDATIVERLEQAGAIPLGALHMAEFALSPTGLNAHLGPGRHPRHAERASGGSSSGSGMAVGDGHVALAIGSDTGGSIRLPAAFCGIVGLKPTQYRISLAGAMPLSPSLDCLGPMTRSVALCAKAFSVMAGADPGDSSCMDLPAPENQWMHIQATSLTVAIPEFPEHVPLCPEMRQVFVNTKHRLSEAGVHCVNVKMPDLELFGKLSGVLQAVESAAIHRQGLYLNPDRYGRQVRRRITRGLLLGGMDYFDALRLRKVMLARFMQETLNGADALLLPSTPDIAPRITDTIGDDEHALEKLISQVSYWTRGINYLGVPALSVPAGFGKENMPLGVQLVGAPLGEDRLFALGHLVHSADR